MGAFLEMGMLGVSEFRAAVAAMDAAISAGSREIVSLAAARVIADAQANFVGSHRKGAPHVGGDKPNVVSGTLRRSIRGDGMRMDALGSWTTRVGPQTVYARAIELGNPHSHSGAYPYFGPAVLKNRGLITAIAIGAWSKAI